MSEGLPVVLVTGAARRIGAVIARTLHGSGYNVVIHYHRSRSEAEALRVKLDKLRANSASLVQGDLCDVPHLTNLVEQAADYWGRLDGLVNNASSFYPTPCETVDTKAWQELLGSNLQAPFFLVQAALPHLRQSGGAVVNLTDIHAERGLSGYPVYSIAKAGLVALTRTLAKELAPKVRVNAVAPGAILWPENESGEEQQRAILAQIPLQRCGTPDDIARTVLFLLRDAPYITGQILAVDGGRSLFSG